MNVLATIVIPPHLAVSGAVNAAKALSSGLSKYCNIDIAIMAFEEKQTLFDDVKVLERRSTNFLNFTKRILPNKFRTLFYQSDIPSLVRSGNYDLIHIHNAIPTLAMKRIAQACLQKNIPYVVSTHGFVELTTKSEAYSLHFYERIAGYYLIDRPLDYIIHHASQIFSLSPLEQPLLSNLRIPPEKITVVTNGVDRYYRTTPTQRLIETVCTKFALPFNYNGQNDIPVAFYLGNHTQNKGLHVLLDALSLTDKPFLVIVGGKKRDTISYNTYQEHCNQNQHIVFTDLLTQEEILSLLHYADLFVFPTLADTLPLVVLEAMACGLPILSTKVGGIPYQVDEQCGLLVKPNDPFVLKEGFERLLSDRTKMIEMGTAAKERVHQKFNWEQSAQIAYTAYQQIIQK